MNNEATGDRDKWKKKTYCADPKIIGQRQEDEYIRFI